MDDRAFLTLIDRRSRFNRSKPGAIERDSIPYWEFTLANELVWCAALAEGARACGKDEPIRRLRAEADTAFAVAMAYTDLGPLALMKALRASGGKAPTYSYVDRERVYASHPLRDLITAHRPTV
jgi:hypothetical protein